MPSHRMVCQAAARELIETPAVSDYPYGGLPGLFTDLDIVAIGAARAQWTTQDDRRKAYRAASNLLNVLYTKGHIVRFGPVKVPGHAGTLDYLRFRLDAPDATGRIIYASVEHAPELIETPNGVFGRLSPANDRIAAPGRRAGTDRNDFVAWEDQAALVAEVAGSDGVTEQREIERLQTELYIARTKLADALEEIARLRKHSARSLTKEQIFEVIGPAIDDTLAAVS